MCADFMTLFTRFQPDRTNEADRYIIEPTVGASSTNHQLGKPQTPEPKQIIIITSTADLVPVIEVAAHDRSFQHVNNSL